MTDAASDNDTPWTLEDVVEDATDYARHYVRAARSTRLWGGLADATAAAHARRGLPVAAPIEIWVRDRFDRDPRRILARLLRDAPASPDAHDALFLIARDHRRSADASAPELDAWLDRAATDLGRGRSTRPKGSVGRSSSTNLVRNAMIQRLVYIISLVYGPYGIGAARNEATEGMSACDIVAKASGLAYTNVQRIWAKKDSDPALMRAQDLWLDDAMLFLTLVTVLCHAARLQGKLPTE